MVVRSLVRADAAFFDAQREISSSGIHNRSVVWGVVLRRHRVLGLLRCRCVFLVLPLHRSAPHASQLQPFHRLLHRRSRVGHSSAHAMSKRLAAVVRRPSSVGL